MLAQLEDHTGLDAGDGLAIGNRVFAEATAQLRRPAVASPEGGFFGGVHAR